MENLYLLCSWIIAMSTAYVSLPPDQETLLVDFIPFLDIPLKVAVFVCWNNEKSFRLVRKLMAQSDGNSYFMQLRNESVENLSLLDTLEPHQHLAVVDLACPNTERFLEEAQYRIYHKIRWVVLNVDQLDGEHRELRILEMLKRLPITGNSNVFYFAQSNEGEMLVKDVYRISMETDLISSVVAIWQNGTFEDTRMGQAVSVRRRNQHRAPIRTTIVYTSNYTLRHFDDYENSQIDAPSRTGYKIVKTLYDIYLNATMDKLFSTDWCYPNSPGLCSDIINNRSEAGGTWLFITDARLKLVEFTKVPIHAYVRFVYKAPNLSTTENIFRLPFDSYVWICTIGLILFTGTLFLGAAVIKRKMESRQDDLIDAAFDIIPVAMQQGTLIYAKSIAQRTLVLVSLIGLMFLGVSFSAKIVSLIQAPSEKISTVKDLLDSKLEVGSHDTAYNRHYLTTATEPVRRALFEQKIMRKNGSMNLYGLNEGIARVREGLFAFHVYTSMGYHLVGETFDEVEKCSLRELDFVSISQGYVPVKVNYTLREHFHVGLMRILEMGIYARVHGKMHFVKPSCTKGVSFRPLNLIDIRFAVGLMGWGLATASLVLLMEAVWKRYSLSRIPVFHYIE